ncbi:hypothetical protein ACFB49_06210 [Sphingomonas sp. DBB INV C78]
MDAYALAKVVPDVTTTHLGTGTTDVIALQARRNAWNRFILAEFSRDRWEIPVSMNERLHQFFMSELERLDVLHAIVAKDLRLARRMYRLRVRACEDFLDMVGASGP